MYIHSFIKGILTIIERKRYFIEFKNLCSSFMKRSLTSAALSKELLHSEDYTLIWNRIIKWCTNFLPEWYAGYWNIWFSTLFSLNNYRFWPEIFVDLYKISWLESSTICYRVATYENVSRKNSLKVICGKDLKPI